MNQYECARRWATNDKDRKPSGKAGSSMYYKGDTIYSYGSHWPLAYKVTLSDSGREVALMNAGFCSRSTARHTTVVYWALVRAKISSVYIESDLFNTITDEASLAHAHHITIEHGKDRAYEAKVYARKQAKRDREYNGDKARRELESMLGIGDLEELSYTAAIKLRNILCGMYHNNFRAQWHWRSRHNGLDKTHPIVIDVVAAAINEDPTRLKTPGFLFTLIENVKILAA